MLSRRDALGGAAGVLATILLPGAAAAGPMQDRIAEFTGGVQPGSGRITLIVPELAENGARVPVAVDAPGAQALMLLASENPEPRICTVLFGPASGSRLFSTRIRLASSQDVIVVVKLDDGNFAMASASVEVTVGGCIG
jgi:sulfur-oxidizing protein SoxY